MVHVVFSVLAVAGALGAYFCALTAAAVSRALPRESEGGVNSESRPKRTSEALMRLSENPMGYSTALQIWQWIGLSVSAISVTFLWMSIVDDNDSALGLLYAAMTFIVVGVVVLCVPPRRIGRRFHTQIALSTAQTVRLLKLILGPIPRVAQRLGSWVDATRKNTSSHAYDDDELRDYVARASESDVIDESEAEIIQSVFELTDTRVRAVMVPRTDMVTVRVADSLNKVMDIFLHSGFSRMPVVGQSADDIFGIVYLKDVAYLDYQLRNGLEPPRFKGMSWETITAQDIQRQVRFVPESKLASDFLSEMQKDSTHVAVVVDEYGGTAGLVTLEDLLEEIVGEIVDEYDHEDVPIHVLDEGLHRVSARTSVDDFAEYFGIDLESEDEVDTVGGLLAKTLGSVPISGSKVSIQGLLLTVERLEGRRNRVSHILVSRDPEHLMLKESHEH